MEIRFTTTKFLFINPIEFAKHGNSLELICSFTLYKEVEELKSVERKFAKALGIPI